MSWQQFLLVQLPHPHIVTGNSTLWITSILVAGDIPERGGGRGLIFHSLFRAFCALHAAWAVAEERVAGGSKDLQCQSQDTLLQRAVYLQPSMSLQPPARRPQKRELGSHASFQGQHRDKSCIIRSGPTTRAASESHLSLPELEPLCRSQSRANKIKWHHLDFCLFDFHVSCSDCI